jgi:hypothetical protein
MKKILLIAAVTVGAVFKMYWTAYCDEYPKLVSVEEYNGHIRQYITDKKGNKKLVITDQEILFYNTFWHIKKKIILTGMDRAWASKDGSYVGYGFADFNLFNGRGSFIRTIPGLSHYRIFNVSISTNGIIGIIYTDIKEDEDKILKMYDSSGQIISGVYEKQHIAAIDNIIGDGFMICINGGGWDFTSTMTYITLAKSAQNRYEKAWAKEFKNQSRPKLSKDGRYIGIVDNITIRKEGPDENCTDIYVYDRNWEEVMKLNIPDFEQYGWDFTEDGNSILIHGISQSKGKYIGRKIYLCDIESHMLSLMKNYPKIEVPEEGFESCVIVDGGKKLCLGTLSHITKKYYLRVIDLQSGIEKKIEVSNAPVTEDGEIPSDTGMSINEIRGNHIIKIMNDNKYYTYDIGE